MALRVIDGGQKSETDPHKARFERVAAALQALLSGMEPPEQIAVLQMLAKHWRECTDDAVSELAFSLENPEDEEAISLPDAVADIRHCSALSSACVATAVKLSREEAPRIQAP